MGITLNHPAQGSTNWYSAVDNNWSTLETKVTTPKTILAWGGYAAHSPGYPVPWGVAVVAWVQTTDNEGYSRILLPFGGTINNLFVALNGFDGTTNMTFTVLQNGSATAITTTLVGVASGNDTTHSVSVAAGDELSIKVTTSGTAPNFICSLELDPS
jgi:hypothetical protein